MTNFKLSRTSDWFSVVSPQTFDAGCVPLVPLNKNSQLMIPFVGRIAKNNGIQGYDPRSDRYADLKFEFGNDKSGNYSSISISQVGNQRAFYQPNPWIGSQNMFCLKPLSFSMNHYVGLYFCAIFNSQLKVYSGGYSSYPVKSDIENWKIKVPVTADGQLDVQYMEQYIKRIEAQYIKRIEAYLSVLGYDSIDDCELSSQDLKVLSGPDKWGKFRIGNLFDIYKTKSLNKVSLTPASGNDKYPYVTRTIYHNGVESYTGFIDKVHLNLANTFSLGLLQMSFRIQKRPWYAGQFVRLIVPKVKLTNKQMLYFNTLFNRFSQLLDPQAVKSVDNKFLNGALRLPVTPDGKPDCNFMDQYITAIEKKKVLKLKQAMGHKLELYREVSHQN